MVTSGEMLPGLEIVFHKKYKDVRGNFCETWKNDHDNMRGSFRQLNTAVSIQNVIRGMHRQDQTKLVMPVVGKIFDVALEPETGRWFGIELDNTCGLLVPPEYAHGYLVMSLMSVVQYVVDQPYNKALEENFKWDGYGIEWPIKGQPVLSDKDS